LAAAGIETPVGESSGSALVESGMVLFKAR
jgi:hypothetical protein